MARPTEIYNYLEPLYNDYRKLRIQNQDGTYTLSHVDAVVDQMLHSDYLFDIALPRLPTRSVAWFKPLLRASWARSNVWRLQGLFAGKGSGGTNHLPDTCSVPYGLLVQLKTFVADPERIILLQTGSLWSVRGSWIRG